MRKGYVQVYTGDGKGKTTAALGLGFRAVGRGLKVYVIQFLKGGDTGELYTIKKLGPDYQLYRFGCEKRFFFQLNNEEKKQVEEDIKKGLELAREIMRDRQCNIIILDEITGLICNGLVTVEEVCQLIKQRPDCMEMVLTGREVPDEIVKLADLVTEMKPVKHYYEKGVKARIGIEK